MVTLRWNYGFIYPISTKFQTHKRGFCCWKSRSVVEKTIRQGRQVHVCKSNQRFQSQWLMVTFYKNIGQVHTFSMLPSLLSTCVRPMTRTLNNSIYKSPAMSFVLHASSSKTAWSPNVKKEKVQTFMEYIEDGIIETSIVIEEGDLEFTFIID